MSTLHLWLQLAQIVECCHILLRNKGNYSAELAKDNRDLQFPLNYFPFYCCPGINNSQPFLSCLFWTSSLLVSTYSPFGWILLFSVPFVSFSSWIFWFLEIERRCLCTFSFPYSFHLWKCFLHIFFRSFCINLHFTTKANKQFRV